MGFQTSVTTQQKNVPTVTLIGLTVFEFICSNSRFPNPSCLEPSHRARMEAASSLRRHLMKCKGYIFWENIFWAGRLSHLGNTKANVLLGSWWLLLTLCTQLQHMSHLRYPDFLLCFKEKFTCKSIKEFYILMTCIP